jgi:hypothetical protein
MEKNIIENLSSNLQEKNPKDLAQGFSEILEFVLNPANHPGNDYISFPRPMATAISFLQEGQSILRGE